MRPRSLDFPAWQTPSFASCRSKRKSIPMPKTDPLEETVPERPRRRCCRITPEPTTGAQLAAVPQATGRTSQPPPGEESENQATRTPPPSAEAPNAPSHTASAIRRLCGRQLHAAGIRRAQLKIPQRTTPAHEMSFGREKGCSSPGKTASGSKSATVSNASRKTRMDEGCSAATCHRGTAPSQRCAA